MPEPEVIGMGLALPGDAVAGAGDGLDDRGQQIADGSLPMRETSVTRPSTRAGSRHSTSSTASSGVVDGPIFTPIGSPTAPQAAACGPLFSGLTADWIQHSVARIAEPTSHEPPAASRPTNLQVRSLEAVPVALPPRRQWRWRGLGGDLGRWVIVRVHTDGAHVGLGEATPLPDWGGDHGRYAGETPQTVVHVVQDLLAPVLAGLDPFDVEPALAAMDATVKGHAYAKAAVEMALWDLQGKVCGQPVHRLLGRALPRRGGGRAHDRDHGAGRGRGGGAGRRPRRLSRLPGEGHRRGRP
jgi:hypothetical protein